MRLLTRSDFDGSVCGALLMELGLVDGKNKQFAMISVGHSIFNRTSTVNVGSLVLKYGGGGHRQVGTCQVDPGQVDRIADEILQVINSA